MTGSTINYGHPFPEGGDKVAVHRDLEKLAKSVDAREKLIERATDGAIPYRGWLDQFTAGSPEPFSDLEDGRYGIRDRGTAEAFDLPQNLLGDVIKESSGTQITITYRPNDAAAGWGTKLEWTRATNSSGILRDRWQQLEKSIMRTAPVVLTSPSGDFPQTDSRGAVRIPFTVPTTIGKIRVHMRPWNFRTGDEWGPAKLEGLMVATQESEFSGTITGSRWYAPNTEGAVISGSTGYTSEWFYAGLTEGATFLLSYAVEWQDDARNLVQGMCWSNFDTTKWDSTEPAIYQNGWGGFGLQPMDIWIECEAPSTVPVYGYFDSSNGVFANGQDVFSAYPAVHARRHKAFAAVTAAGGWSPMDDTFHDSNIINRFGYPARMLDRLYMSMGANIAARDASAQDAIAKMEQWLNVRLPGLGNPPVYMLTQISRDTSDGTTDTAGTLSEWNEWVRYEATQRDDVAGLIDQAAMFADPEKPWTARTELRESPGDVHFSVMGQKLRAQALDGEITLPMLTAKDADDVPWRVGFQWAGEPNDSQSVMRVGDREAARNLYLDPALTDPSTWSSADTVTSIELGPSWTGNANSTGFSLYGEAGSIHAGASPSHRVPVSPGDVVTMGVNLATSEGFSLRARIYWYDSSGNFITSEDAPNQPSSGEKVFTRVVVTGTAPEGAAAAYPHFWLYEGDVNSTVPATGYIDGLTLERGETDGAYFDGDTAGWDRIERLEEQIAQLQSLL